tara:strand:- start:190 stop:420 length:231 start_codon:yes stop_codon:yes gene_type:complete
MVLSIARRPSEGGCCDFWQRPQTHGKHRAMVNVLKNIHAVEGATVLGGQPCLSSLTKGKNLPSEAVSKRIVNRSTD